VKAEADPASKTPWIFWYEMMDSASFEMRGGVAEESILLGYDSASLGKQFPCFEGL
jgi:hypothetical protein